MLGDHTGWPVEYQEKIERLERRIQHADKLEQACKVDEALAAYKACFDVAIRDRAPFFIQHLTQIWMGVGACYANRDQWKSALQMYLLVESALNSTPSRLHLQPAPPKGWARFVPQELQVFFPEDFDPDPHLAAAYESIGLAYDYLEQGPPAMDYYRKAVGLHTRLGDEAAAARVWRAMALGCQARRDWPALEKTARRMLELYQAPDDIQECLTAWRFLAQACWNQGKLSEAMEGGRLAVEAGQILNHPDLAQDRKQLEDFKQGLVANLRQRQEQGQRRNGAALFDHAKLQPLARLFTKVTFEKVSENGASEYQFALRTKRFEEALRVVRAFPLSALPVNLPLLRENAGPKAKLPKDAELWIEWYLADPEPGRAIDKTILPPKIQAEMAGLNLQSRRFRIVLEEETLGFLGKPRRELIADHAPFVLDWRGVEGIAAQARSAWQDPDYDHVEPILDLLEQRLREHGPATGLQTQMGDLYRLIRKPEQAIDHYVREVQLALRPEGRPGLGALTALSGLGAAFKTLEEFEFARAAYRLALTLNPNYYEALLALAGLLEDFGQQLLCLSRAYRIRPDEAALKPVVQHLCEAQPETADDVWQVIQEASRTVDITHPVPEIALANPAAVLRELLPEVFAEAGPASASTPTPEAADVSEIEYDDAAYTESILYADAPAAPAVSEPVTADPAPPEAAEVETRYVEVFDTFAELEPVGASLLETVRDAGRVLVHFALAHLGPTPRSGEPRWGVGIENVTEFGRSGALTPRPGATLQLASDPEVCVRVMLADHTCTVHLMQEFQIPNTPLKGLKPAHTEQCLARADALLDMLNSFVARGLLVKLGQRLLYFDPA